jgi:hypothetical protein
MRKLAPLLTLLLSACAYVGTTRHGLVLGSALQTLIDVKIRGAMIASLPGAHVGKSSCPALLALNAQPAPLCSLQVDGQRYPIDVWWDADARGPKVNPGAVILQMNRIAEAAPAFLSGLGTIRCPGPALRVMAVGQKFSCPVVAGRLAGTRVAMKVVDASGRVWFYRPKNLPQTADDKALAALAIAHKRGRPTIADGPLFERWVAANMKKMAKVWHGPAYGDVRVTCPPKMNLSGDRVVYCMTYFDQYALRTRVWFDSTATYHAETIDFLYDLSAVRTTAEDYYRKLLLANGIMQDVHVACRDRGMEVITPPAYRKCVLHSGGKSSTMYMLFHRGGYVNYYVLQDGQSSLPPGALE